MSASKKTESSEGVSIEMLPLPEADGFMETFDTYGCSVGSEDAWGKKSVQDYARAVAEHNVKARDAEIEALRAEVDEWKRRGGAYFQTAEQQGKRADRLEEVLRNSSDALERLAFAIRAPNAHTPQLVELAIAMRAATRHDLRDHGQADAVGCAESALKRALRLCSDFPE